MSFLINEKPSAKNHEKQLTDNKKIDNIFNVYKRIYEKNEKNTNVPNLQELDFLTNGALQLIIKFVHMNGNIFELKEKKTLQKRIIVRGSNPLFFEFLDELVYVYVKITQFKKKLIVDLTKEQKMKRKIIFLTQMKTDQDFLSKCLEDAVIFSEIVFFCSYEKSNEFLILMQNVIEQQLDFINFLKRIIYKADLNKFFENDNFYNMQNIFDLENAKQKIKKVQKLLLSDFLPIDENIKEFFIWCLATK